MRVTTRRVQDAPDEADGYRVLVDRLWPRGVSKERARLDCWAKDLAPSSELRRWFHADRSRFAEFADRYRAELDAGDHDARIAELRAHAPVTLLYAARADGPNHADVLADWLADQHR